MKYLIPQRYIKSDKERVIKYVFRLFLFFVRLIHR